MDLNVSDPDSFKKLEKIQSYFRQNYVKSELLKLRNVYEEIFNEIEGPDSDVKVVWLHETAICLPKFVSKKEIKPSSNNQVVKFTETTATSHGSTGNQMNEDKLFDIDLNIEQMNCLSSENLRKLSKSELLSVRENVSLEMLWIQQAIQSRVQVKKFLLHLP